MSRIKDRRSAPVKPQKDFLSIRLPSLKKQLPAQLKTKTESNQTEHFVNVFKTQIVVFNSLISWYWLLCIVCFAIYRSSLVRIPGPVVLGNLTGSSLLSLSMLSLTLLSSLCFLQLGFTVSGRCTSAAMR